MGKIVGVKLPHFDLPKFDWAKRVAMEDPAMRFEARGEVQYMEEKPLEFTSKPLPSLSDLTSDERS